jgi:hypothetical protein
MQARNAARDLEDAEARVRAAWVEFEDMRSQLANMEQRYADERRGQGLTLVHLSS